MRPALICLLVWLAACGEKPKAPPAAGEYQGDGRMLWEIPDFMLLESRGVALRRSDLLGKVWVASVIFTRCQTHCIPMCAEMAKLQEEFKSEPEFRIVAATVDPAHDTPPVLKEFARGHGAYPDRWLFLTGDRQTMFDYVKALKISVDPENPMAHSTYFVLVDKNGWARGAFEQPDRKRMAKLREMIRTLLEEKKKSA